MRAMVQSSLCVKINHKIPFTIGLTTALLLLCAARPILALVQPASISTAKDTAITINLSNRITLISAPVVVISSSPSNGEAIALACNDGSNVCIRYTPTTGFVGTDIINYTVNNDAGTPEPGIVTIKVGELSVQDQGLVPTAEVDNTLNTVCLQQQSSSVSDLCNAYDTATQSGSPEDLRIMLNALTPQDIAAQGKLGSEMVIQQLANISKHLHALRQGQKLSALGDLSIQYRDKTISGEMLAGSINTQQNGGAASADDTNNRWGWFISGNLGGGEQNSSEYEDGFEFNSNGVSSGVDFRWGNIAVLGGALGWASTSMDLEHNAGGLEGDSTTLLLYTSYYPSGKTYIDAIISVNNQQFQSSRTILFGSVDAVATSETDSTTTALSVAGGYEFIFKKFSATFEGKAEYLNSVIDGYSESGATPYDVTISELEYDRLSLISGWQLTYAISHAKSVYIPQLDLFWVHHFTDDAEVIEGYFTADTTQTRFRFNTNTTDTDYAKVDLGLSAVFPGGSTGFVQAGSTLFRTNFQNWRLSLGYRLEF